MAAAITETRNSLQADCPRKDLFDAVQTVGHAVSGRSSLPILSHILIQSEADGLRLIATDLELGISCRIPAIITEPGGLTAPAKPLTEVLANLPDKSDVAISVDRSHTIRVHSERSDYKILGLPAEEYPNLPEVRDQIGFAIPQAKLREMIRHTLFAVSTDESRAILTGIYVEFADEQVRFVATDTHRLAVHTATVKEARGAQNAIVPARAMNELTRLLSDADGDVAVTLTNHEIKFALPGNSEVQIVSRLIEGQFPNYQRVIPANPQKTLMIPVQPLLSAVRRASIVARENAHRVVLRAENDKLIITADSQIVGNAYEEVEIAQEGAEVSIAFNARYLMDVLAVVDAEGVHLELTEPLKPGLLRPAPTRTEDGTPIESDYLCVLMPMQIV